MATSAYRMSIMTGRMGLRAPCIVRSTYSTPVASNSRRFLTYSNPTKNAQNSSKPVAEQQAETMDWDTYFNLRRTRRNYERVFTAPSAIGCFAAAGYYFAQRDFDPTPIFGMEQVIVYGVGAIAAGIAGLAAGPLIGSMVFRAFNSKSRPLVDRMDKEFYKHIVKNRANPTANSVRNPVPDFYGEKIKSVKEYRAWLRKQREYRRKSEFFVDVD
ncbi:TIM23 complex component [Entomortierella lignicola]|nr:TIM23 complex component [Entomortierella lignicola]